jgi:hypothetical protein
MIPRVDVPTTGETQMRDLIPVLFLVAAALAFGAAALQTYLLRQRRERLMQTPRLINDEVLGVRRETPALRRRFEGIPLRPTLTRR